MYCISTIHINVQYMYSTMLHYVHTYVQYTYVQYNATSCTYMYSISTTHWYIMTIIRIYFLCHFHQYCIVLFVLSSLQEKTTLVLLSEDGSLRIYLASNNSDTKYWVQPQFQASSPLAALRPRRKKVKEGEI